MAPPRDASASEPLWHLVYRYWFWQWLFDDVNRGDLVRRVCLIVMFAIAAVIEALGGRASAAVFYVASVISATIELTAGVAWIFLRPR